MRTDLTAAVGLGGKFCRDLHLGLLFGHCGNSFCLIFRSKASRSDGLGFLGFQRREFRDTAEKGINAGADFQFIGPLLVQRFLQHVDGFQAQVDDRRRWLNFSVTQTSDQIFNAVRDGAEPPQANLRRRPF